MTQAADLSIEPLRLLFEMERDENPRLYDDLIRFNKGTKRVNRLRFLAHEGLLSQQELAASTSLAKPHEAAAVLSATRHLNLVAAGQVVQAFDAPPPGEED